MPQPAEPIPMVVGGRLMEERQRNLWALGNREAELQRLSRRLGLALEASNIGVWEYDMVTGDLVWDDRMNEIYADHKELERESKESILSEFTLSDIERYFPEYPENIRL